MDKLLYEKRRLFEGHEPKSFVDIFGGVERFPTVDGMISLFFDPTTKRVDHFYVRQKAPKFEPSAPHHFGKVLTVAERKEERASGGVSSLSSSSSSSSSSLSAPNAEVTEATGDIDMGTDFEDGDVDDTDIREDEIVDRPGKNATVPIKENETSARQLRFRSRYQAGNPLWTADFNQAVSKGDEPPIPGGFLGSDGEKRCLGNNHIALSAKDAHVLNRPHRNFVQLLFAFIYRYNNHLYRC